jgi:hypothetical protein
MDIKLWNDVCTSINSIPLSTTSNATIPVTDNGIIYYQSPPTEHGWQDHRQYRLANCMPRQRQQLHHLEYQIDVVACWPTVDYHHIPAALRSSYPTRCGMVEHPDKFLQVLQDEIGINRRQAKTFRNSLINFSTLSPKSEVWNGTYDDEDEKRPLFDGITPGRKLAIAKHPLILTIADETLKFAEHLMSIGELQSTSIDKSKHELFYWHTGKERQIMDIVKRYCREHKIFYFDMYDGLDISELLDTHELEAIVHAELGARYQFKQSELAPHRKRAQVFGFDNLKTLHKERRPMLWDGFLPQDELNLIAGLKSKGKTTLTLQLALAIAQGESHFLGRKLNCRYNRALIAKFEGSGEARLADLARNYPQYDTGNRLEFFPATRMSEQEVVEQLEALQKKNPYDLIIIDCLGNIVRGDQMRGEVAQEFYRKFEHLAQQTCVLFIAHLNKDAYDKAPSGRQIKGSSDWANRARTGLIFAHNTTATNSERYLFVEFEDDMSIEFKEDAMVLDFDPETKLYLNTGRTIPKDDISKAGSGENLEEQLRLGKFLNEYLTAPGKWANVTELQKESKSTVSRSTFIRWLNELVTDGMLRRRKGGAKNQNEYALAAKAK